MFVLKGVSLWVINEVSNTNRQLTIIDEKSQHNMRTAEETASLALVFFFFVQIKKRVFSAVFSNAKLTWIRIVVIGNNTELTRFSKL